jgi:hypothetical protein
MKEQLKKIHIMAYDKKTFHYYCAYCGVYSMYKSDIQRHIAESKINKKIKGDKQHATP